MAQLAQLEVGINEVRRRHAEVAEQLRKADPLYARIQEPPAYSLEQIQREVIDDDQTVLLEFMLTENASYAWAVRKNAIKLYKLENQNTINDAARKVNELTAVEPKGDVDQRLRDASVQLAKLVIDPLAEQLTARRLIIVADGGLHYVPFQLLPDPSNPNEPLVANHEIINAPSASILGQLRKEKQQREPTKKLLAAFGDPVFRTNYADFKGSSGGELLASSVKVNPIEPWRRA
jgi:CHAT domain-containing protein